MRKKLTKTSKVIQYVKKNPKAKAKEIAQAVGVPTSSVYQIAYKVRKQMREGMNKVPMTALSPKPAARKYAKGMKVIAISTSNKSIHSKADMVNHPPHYKAGGIETIDFIEAKNLGYNLGNVVKYVSRADLKGNKLEDLQKAKWYLDRAISNLSKT
jgi:hypothetical protein